jgi:sugar/nucleoside kinase (ribokinase family)
VIVGRVQSDRRAAVPHQFEPTNARRLEATRLKLHAIGFGSLNLDEIWEVSGEFLLSYDLRPGEEYVRDVKLYDLIHPALEAQGALKAAEPGGSAANMIAALNKMGFATGFYGATGTDAEEGLALESLGKPENVKIKRVELPAGRCLALIDRADPGRDRALVILPNANDLAGSEELDFDYFRQAQWVHLTSFVSQKALAAQIKVVERIYGSTQISFDPGALYAARGANQLKPILSRTDLLFVAQEELETLTSQPAMDAAVDFLFEIGVRMVIVKLGAEGMRAFAPGKSVYQPAVFPREIRDRTGAGDVAAAGFLAGTIESIGLEASLELAAIMASKSIEGYGRGTYPDKAFFEEALSRLRGSR